MTHTDRMNYYDRVIAGVRVLPGVENAAFVSDLPFQQSGNSQSFQIEGRSTQENGPVQLALYRVGTNDDLKTLGVRVIEGRLIEESEWTVPALALLGRNRPEQIPCESKNSPNGHLSVLIMLRPENDSALAATGRKRIILKAKKLPSLYAAAPKIRPSIQTPFTARDSTSEAPVAPAHHRMRLTQARCRRTQSRMRLRAAC
jgi:hypothetical protein